MSYVTTIGVIDSSRLANDDSLAGLAKYLPTVGIVIGLFLICVSRIFAHMQVNLTLCSALIVVLWLVLTGGLHMYGLMDTSDGIFSH
ncbi:adenosylcobinamide-GDP ribazoletransferase, partial [Streptomyces caniscabiei]|uniref:adenosylcobinamide-GDP ribazoletransferase n=1 Tax=Streptomyces caniscabiei TaxID=2746961 RepID=UPI0038F6A03D